MTKGGTPGPQTVLFRQRPRFTRKELLEVQSAIDGWTGSEGSRISFTIELWGRTSVLVKGRLRDLCLFLRKELPHISDDKQRDPHVKIFARGRGGRGALFV